MISGAPKGKVIGREKDKGISLAEAIREAYLSGQEDETLEPIIKTDGNGPPRGRICPGDFVIFYNIRGEREIELTMSLTDPDFRAFSRPELGLKFVTMISYSPSLPVEVAFPPEVEIQNTLTEVVTRNGGRLVKVAESEKASHIGYFFNGKKETPFPGEQRVIIPSWPSVSSPAEAPAMRAGEIAEEVVARVRQDTCPVIVANLANVDVVGHTENEMAILEAIETVDLALSKIAGACRELKVPLFVTSDHGTVEEWLYPDGSINTGHTKNPVPFLLADYGSAGDQKPFLRPRGELADVAPTLLHFLGLKKPEEMKGQSLLLQDFEPGRGRAVLLILDGWGWREEEEGNLLRRARTPHFDRLWEEFTHSLLDASGEAVGLPRNTVGNSEAGHLHLGAGRRVYLDRVRIDRAIEEGSFFENPVLVRAVEGARKEGRAFHLLGIVSHYSSHGSIDHLFALLRLARSRELKRVYIHAFVGRRGERPASGAAYVEKIEREARAIGVGEVVTVIGRHWALDREGNWDRVEKTFRALVFGEGRRVRPAEERVPGTRLNDIRIKNKG